MKRILFVLLTISANSFASAECSEEKAFKVGMEAIKKAYPQSYETKAPYELVKIEGEWVVLGYTPEGMRGGGAPTAVVDPETCEVLNVYLAR